MRHCSMSSERGRGRLVGDGLPRFEFRAVFIGNLGAGVACFIISHRAQCTDRPLASATFHRR